MFKTHHASESNFLSGFRSWRSVRPWIATRMWRGFEASCNKICKMPRRTPLHQPNQMEEPLTTTTQTPREEWEIVDIVEKE